MWPEDVDLLHDIWLKLSQTESLGSRLHHRDVVGVALRRLQGQLSGEQKQDVVDAIRKELRKE
jgi:hypothetical protein